MKIDNWDENEAAARAERMNSKTTSEELEGIARGWNWDGGMSGLVNVIQHPRCDLGTAMRIYWLSDPEYFLTQPVPKKRRKVDENCDDGLSLILEIEARVEAGFYRKAEIAFDPELEVRGDKSRCYLHRHLLAESEFVCELPGWAYQAVGPSGPKRAPGRPVPTKAHRQLAEERASKMANLEERMNKALGAFRKKMMAERKKK